jgi:hypothetical protein
MQSTYIGEVVSDRQGRIFAEVTVQGTNNASGSFATSMEIEKRHWIETPMIEERQVQEMSFLEMGGILYNGPLAGTYNAFLSCAPGNEPALRGKIEQAQGLALSSQSQLNTLVGNVFAYKNSRYPNIDFRLAGNYRNLDIAPQELVSVSVAQSDTPRGIIFNKKPFAIRNISWMFDHTNELLLPSMGVAEVTQGFAGDTITIPDVPPTDGPDSGGGFYIPPIIVPPLPIPTIPLVTGTATPIPRVLYLGTHGLSIVAGYLDWAGSPPYLDDQLDPDVMWDGNELFTTRFAGYYSVDIKFAIRSNFASAAQASLSINLVDMIRGTLTYSGTFEDYIGAERVSHNITIGPALIHSIHYFEAATMLKVRASLTIAPSVTHSDYEYGSIKIAKIS